MEIKYTNGRKVQVIQELNSTQTIVREIFIDNKGIELPHGENFTVLTSELSDSPLASWKERELKNYEKEYEESVEEWRNKIENETDNLRRAFQKVYSLTKSIQSLSLSLSNNGRVEFMRLLDFMSGAVKWVVIDEYVPKIIPFSELDIYQKEYDRKRIDGIKLITLFGKTDGGLQYRLNQYKDGSGSDTACYFFCEKHEAIGKLKEIIQSRNDVNEGTIEVAEKYGIKIDREIIDKYKVKKLESYKKEQARLEKSLEGYKDEIKKIEKL